MAGDCHRAKQNNRAWGGENPSCGQVGHAFCIPPTPPTGPAVACFLSREFVWHRREMDMRYPRMSKEAIAPDLDSS